MMTIKDKPIRFKIKSDNNLWNEKKLFVSVDLNTLERRKTKGNQKRLSSQ